MLCYGSKRSEVGGGLATGRLKGRGGGEKEDSARDVVAVAVLVDFPLLDGALYNFHRADFGDVGLGTMFAMKVDRDNLDDVIGREKLPNAV